MSDNLNDEQIRETAIRLGLSSDFIRKDYFVTKAIALLVSVKNDYFDLVFQGGTSLSKGHGVINRLSEDVDFRVITKPAGFQIGKDARRRELRAFRHLLIKTLSDAGFEVPSQNIRVFYEGRYMSLRAVFDGSQGIFYLKPHIAIDCFLGTLVLKPEIKNISSLVKVTLGDAACDHSYFPVNCVSLNETAAEKWVALSRRIFEAEKKPRDSDKHLVRHLYDLYQLQTKQLLTDDYFVVLEKVLEKEQLMFGSDSDDFTKNITSAFEILRSHPQWQDAWRTFLEQMVYNAEKPDLIQAVAVVEQMRPTSRITAGNQNRSLLHVEDALTQKLTYQDVLFANDQKQTSSINTDKNHQEPLAKKRKTGKIRSR